METITKHIPGPWTISDMHGAIDGEDDIMIEYEGFPICTVRGTNDMLCIDEDVIEESSKEMIATAKLIAAAPELLKALIGLLPENQDPVFDGEPSLYAVLKAKAAIKKATE